MFTTWQTLSTDNTPCESTTCIGLKSKEFPLIWKRSMECEEWQSICTVKQVLKNKSLSRSQWWDSVLLLYSACPEAVISHIASPTRLSEQKYICTTSRHSFLAATCCVLLHKSNTKGLIFFHFCFIFYQIGNNRSCTSLLKSGQSCGHITWS